MKRIFLMVMLLFVFVMPLSSAFAIVPSGYVEYLHVKSYDDAAEWFEWQNNQWRFHRILQWQAPQYAIVNNQNFYNLSWVNAEYTIWNTVTGISTLEEVFGNDVSIHLEVINQRNPITLDQLPTLSNPNQFSVFINDVSGGAYEYEYKIYGYGSKLNPIPEPATLSLLGLGLLGLVFRIKKAK